jgi:hypothetical protein
MNTVKLTALRSDQLYVLEIFLELIFKRLWRPHWHSTAGRMSVKNSIDDIRSRNRYIPIRFLVLQNIFRTCYTVDMTVIFDGLIFINLWIKHLFIILQQYGPVFSKYKREQNGPEVLNSFFVLINGHFKYMFSSIFTSNHIFLTVAYLIQLL